MEFVNANTALVFSPFEFLKGFLIKAKYPLYAMDEPSIK